MFKNKNVTSIILFASYLLIGIIAIALFAIRQWMPACLVIGSFIFSYTYLFLKSRPVVLIILALVISYAPHGMFISYPLFYIIFIDLVIKRIKQGGKLLSVDLITILWALICILGIATINRWSSIFSGIQWIHALAVFPLLFYIAIHNNYINKNDINVLLNSGLPLILAFIVIETYVDFISRLMQQDSFFSISNLYAFRGLSIPGNGSNRLAGMLAFFSTILILNNEKWKGRQIKNCFIWFTIYLALFIPFIMISRGALIFFITASIIYFSVKFLSDRKVKLFHILSFILIMLLASKPFIDQLIFRLKNVKYDISTLSRLILWNNSLEQIKNNIIIGKGPGQVVYRALSDRLEDPHNMFLRYGVEFGGISILLILIILVYPFIVFVKNRTHNNIEAMKSFLILAPALLGTLVHSQIDSTFTSRNSGIVIWILWAIMVRQFIELKRNV